MKKRKLLIITLLVCVATSLSAFQFTPISKDFDPNGSGARQTFRVINDSDKIIGVQISALTRDMDLYGNETLEDASNVFYIYPKQVVVQPNSYQTVRVQWKGPAAVADELSYRIEAEQLPLNFNQSTEGANLNILLVYRGTMYVVPEEVHYDLRMLSIKSHIDIDENKFIAIEMQNDGNTHQIMYKPEFTIISHSGGIATSKVTLIQDELKGFAGENILAGQRRVFLVPWPADLKEGQLSATYEMENIR
jgi:fimbrial chaperone protein